MRTRTSILVAALAALSIAPASASAHTHVESRTPAPGSTVQSVKSVRVAFSEAVMSGRLKVTRAGKTVGSATARGAKTSITATFAKKLAKGSYRVSWSLKADDGATQTGSWQFTVS